MKRLIVLLSGAAVLSAFLISVIKAQQQPGAGVYTQAQADAGRTAYDVSCAGCHGADLTGSSDSPALTGPNFTNAWGSRTGRYVLRANASMEDAREPTAHEADESGAIGLLHLAGTRAE